MRKFVISDINGFGDVYYAMMKYLDSISQTDDIELYINGDLIGYSKESSEILLDVMRRIKENNPKFKIIYIGGDWELMIYDSHKNGLAMHMDNDKINSVIDFLGNLPIFHRFEVTMDDKKIVLAHAACPIVVPKYCNLFIKNGSSEEADEHVKTIVTKVLNTTHFNPNNRIGNTNYFTIVGHTPNDNPNGYEYNNGNHTFNINGGCELYLRGFAKYNHFPLVEMISVSKKGKVYKDGDDKTMITTAFKILTFNNEGRIISGNYFFDGGSSQLPIEEDNKILDNQDQSKK